MVQKIAEETKTTTNDYVTLASVKVGPTRVSLSLTHQLLFRLKENNVNAVKYKIEAAQEPTFAKPEELKAETTLAKNGKAFHVLTDPWLCVRVQHKAAVAGDQGNTTCIISGS